MEDFILIDTHDVGGVEHSAIKHTATIEADAQGNIFVRFLRKRIPAFNTKRLYPNRVPIDVVNGIKYAIRDQFQWIFACAGASPDFHILGPIEQGMWLERLFELFNWPGEPIEAVIEHITGHKWAMCKKIHPSQYMAILMGRAKVEVHHYVDGSMWPDGTNIVFLSLDGYIVELTKQKVLLVNPDGNKLLQHGEVFEYKDQLFVFKHDRQGWLLHTVEVSVEQN